MAPSQTLSSEFVSLTRALASEPDNHYSKAETIYLLKQMKVLAATGDAIAQYRLAQIYPKNSVYYYEWMKAAAQQGFTNAMLALSTSLAETGSLVGLRQAANYLSKIFRTNDSFIKNEALALLAQNRLLYAEVKRQFERSNLSPAACFFPSSAKVKRLGHCQV